MILSNRLIALNQGLNPDIESAEYPAQLVILDSDAIPTELQFISNLDSQPHFYRAVIQPEKKSQGFLILAAIKQLSGQLFEKQQISSSLSTIALPRVLVLSPQQKIQLANPQTIVIRNIHTNELRILSTACDELCPTSAGEIDLFLRVSAPIKLSAEPANPAELHQSAEFAEHWRKNTILTLSNLIAIVIGEELKRGKVYFSLEGLALDIAKLIKRAASFENCFKPCLDPELRKLEYGELKIAGKQINRYTKQKVANFVKVANMRQWFVARMGFIYLTRRVLAPREKERGVNDLLWNINSVKELLPLLGITSPATELDFRIIE